MSSAAGRAALRIATRSSPQARTQAQWVADALVAAHPDLDGRAGVRRHDGRPSPGRAAARDRWAGRVRQGGAAGGARRSRRPRRPLGQGPALDHRRRVCASPRSASAGPRTTRSSARRSPTCRRARRSPPARCGAGPSWPPLRPDLAFVELRGNIQTRLAKVPDGGAIVMAVAALEILETDRSDRRRAAGRHVHAGGGAGVRRRRVRGR